MQLSPIVWFHSLGMIVEVGMDTIYISHGYNDIAH